MTLPEIVGPNGFITDGDWVESKDQDPSGEVRLTQLADVGDGEFRDRSDRWMNDEQATRLNVTYLRAGDVLIARMPDPLGRACVCPKLPTRAVTVVDVCIVRAPEHNPKWLMFALNAPQTRWSVASFEAGSTRKRISKKNLSLIPIPVPALPEQHRIVAAIEAHFSRLDAAVASLTRAKANLKRARASVLKAAVEGRLVPTEAALARAEGRDYEPASALLERILAERKAKWAASGGKGKYKEPVAPETLGLPELPVGWVWVSTDEAACEVRNGYSGKPAEEGPVHILRISSVRPRSVDRTDHRYLTGSISDYAAAIASPGDLLVTRYNGSRDFVGVMGLIRGETPVVHPDKLIRVRLATSATVGAWFEVAFNVGASRSFIEGRIRTTAGQAGVSGSDVKAVPVPMPPLAEQHRIVAEVDRRLSVLDALDATVEANLARCARLRQSILKRAFEGRLVPALEHDVAATGS